MIDFLIISSRRSKNNVIEIYPKFRLYPRSHDLMIRGRRLLCCMVGKRRIVVYERR